MASKHGWLQRSADPSRQRPGIDRVCAMPIVKILAMPEIALVLIQRAEQFIKAAGDDADRVPACRPRSGCGSSLVAATILATSVSSLLRWRGGEVRE